ncbi:MAG: B12-binding domain-containing radical SAM protein, partial [Promethearchaeota archaeon]
KCKFCSIRRMYGQGIRYYDVERVIDDIKDAAERGARSILFIDDNITLNVRRLEKICDRIVEEGLDYIEYHTQASAEGLLRRKTLIPKMNKAGFSVVFFGIENVQPKNLNLFNKYIPLQRLKGLVKSLHKNGMISFGGFILGNPDDNEEDINANLKFAKMLNLDFPAFQILTPFPKTEIREEYKEAGLLVNPYDYSKYTGLFGNVKTKYLSAEFLEKEMLRLYYHYYNPIWLLKRFSRLNLLYKYWKYVANIIKKYGKLAISSWNTTMINRLRGKSITQAEDQVIDYFALVREKKRAKPE